MHTGAAKPRGEIGMYGRSVDSRNGGQLRYPVGRWNGCVEGCLLQIGMRIAGWFVLQQSAAARYEDSTTGDEWVRRMVTVKKSRLAGNWYQWK